MPDEIKVCIYIELEGTLEKSGIGAAVRHQIQSLKNENVSISRNPYSLDYDILHINSIGPHSLFLANIAKAAGKKVILHAHTTGEDFINSYHFSEHMGPLLRKYLKRFYNIGDLILCPTEYTRSLLEGYGIKKDIQVISNGIEISRFENLENLRSEYRKKYDLQGITPFCVGHVFAKKGVETFINIALQFPKQKFLWFGAVYKKLVQSNILEMINYAPANCFFTGYVKNILAAYAVGDIFIFPSYNENQGIVILEAASSKKPIIIRDIPTYDGWLREGVNCMKAKSEKEFSTHLQYLIDNPKECTRLANNAYKMVQEHDLQKVGHILAGIYRSV